MQKFESLLRGHLYKLHGVQLFFVSVGIASVVQGTVLSLKKVDSAVGTHDRVYERGYK